MRTNALLDCGADSTFGKEDIAKILQLKNKQKPLKIQTEFLDSGQIGSELVHFCSFVKPLPAENTDHQTMVNTKLVDPTLVTVLRNSKKSTNTSKE